MNEPNESTLDQQKYQLYLEERKLLIDAERESARAFGKAILTFASRRPLGEPRGGNCYENKV